MRGRHPPAPPRRRVAGSVSVLVGDDRRQPAGDAGVLDDDGLPGAGGGLDYVLLDAPPPLEVSDVMPLLSDVDRI